MSTELDQFIGLFTNEHVLQTALVDLFSKIPNTKRVQKLQGALEHGKDIVFRKELLPGNDILVACVVKNHAITGSAYANNKSACTVMNQVRQALKNPYRDLDGIEYTVGAAYVITPHEVPREATLAIEGELKELAGRFKFLCGSELLELFKIYYPTFLTFRGDFFNRYLQELITGLNDNAALTSLARTETLLGAVRSVFTEGYIQPRFVCKLAFAKPLPLGDTQLPFNRRVSADLLANSLTTLYRVTSLLHQAECWSGLAATVEWPWIGKKLARLAKQIPDWRDEEVARYISRSGSFVGAAEREHLEITIPETHAHEYDLGRIRVAISDCLREFRSLCEISEKTWGTLYSQVKNASDLFACLSISHLLRADELLNRCPALFERKTSNVELTASHIELLRQKHSFTVTAPAGYGKTTFCKWNAVNDAKQLLDGKSRTLPIYIPLHKFNSGDGSELRLLTSELQEFIGRNDGAPRRFDHLRIYLDGLDELRTASRRRAVLTAVANGLDVPFPTQFVITARDTAFSAMMSQSPRFRIEGLTPEESKALVSNLLGDKAGEIEEFWHQVEESGNLRELLQVPLLVELVVAVYNRTQKLPPNRYRLYQSFLELLAQGWDRAKGVERGFVYDSDTKLRVLQLLAGRIHAQGRREAEYSEIQVVVDAMMARGGVEVPALVTELLHQGLLVQSGTAYLFPHLSFQEYLASRDLNDPNGVRQTRALMSFLRGDDWWKEVIAFYINGYPSPAELELWARGVIRKIVSGRNTDTAAVSMRIHVLTRMFTNSHPGYQTSLISG